MNEIQISQIHHRCFAKIDLDALCENFENIRALLNENVKVCAIVKADAYGHGSVAVSKELESRTDIFAVGTLEEGMELRKAGIEKDILVLTYVSPYQYDELVENNLTATIYNKEDAEKLSVCAKQKGKTVKIHIAVETGMGRIGFSPDEESADTVKEISELSNVEIEGLFSHYAKADYADKTSANKQTELFDKFISLLNGRDICIPVKHICNSAGIIDMDNHYDMVRMGIALYGMYPSDEVMKERVTLKPCMEVFAHVSHIKEVEKGTPIGYGHSYVAESDRKIATVGIGYADGYNRCLTGKGWVLIGGKKAFITGKVCMDQIMVDVTDIPDVKVGDKVVIMGRMEDEEISAETHASHCETISYEIISTFMPRVKRFYFKDGKLIK